MKRKLAQSIAATAEAVSSNIAEDGVRVLEESELMSVTGGAGKLLLHGDEDVILNPISPIIRPITPVFPVIPIDDIFG